MTREVVTVSSETPIREAAEELACRHLSAAPVLDNGELVGMISEIDIVGALAPRQKGSEAGRSSTISWPRGAAGTGAG